ncbi:MAG: histidine ammonia-lyase [Alphaproteobacteria bacterium]|nr:histidine ammonia-lyase [Alphaproteobacteria bacterium]
MTVIIDTRHDLTLAGFSRAAWQGERLEPTRAALARVAAAREGFLRYLANLGDGSIYGVTSGWGYNARRRIQPDEQHAFDNRPLVAGAASFGDPLPTRVVRGILFARLANLIDGHSATTPRMVEAVVAMLNGERPVPPVPADGNGSAGEILALYHLFAPLSQTLDMAVKEKGGLVNGAPCAAALLADGALAAERRWALAAEVFALSFEAIRAPVESLDPLLGVLWNDADAAAALHLLGRLLADASDVRRGYQAPVSFRILPKVLGRALRAQRVAAAAANAALTAVTDNPVYIPPEAAHPDGRCFSTGGYHDANAVPALDALTANAADLCLLAERHATKLLDGAMSGLPDKLLPNAAAMPGGVGSVAYLPAAINGFLETARAAATVTLLPGAEGSGFGQDDIASPIFPAWHKHETAGRALERALAVLGVVASQALRVTDRGAPRALRDRLDRIRSLVAPVEEPSLRGLGSECGVLADAFRGEIYGIVAAGPG